MGVLHESRSEHDASYRAYSAALKADRHYEPARHNMRRYYERFTFGRSRPARRIRARPDERRGSSLIAESGHRPSPRPRLPWLPALALGDRATDSATTQESLTMAFGTPSPWD